MEFKYEQLSTITRHCNYIVARKVLDINGDVLSIRPFSNRDDICEIKASMPHWYRKGDYIDVIINEMGTAAYSVRLIGPTPMEFCPVCES